MEEFRAIITTSDIVLITGKSSRWAQLLMRDMRDFFGKHPKQLITFSEFCMYTGIEQEEIELYLKKHR